MFKTGSPVVGKNFIDRKKHIPLFLELLKSNQHFMIKAPRRFGKTSLIKHIFNQEKSFTHIYIDIRRASSLKSLSELILNEAYGLSSIDNFIDKSKKSLLELLKLVQKLKIENMAEATIKIFESEQDETEVFLHAFDVVNKIAQKKI